MPPIRRKLIEVSIPLEAINVASAREKSIRHGHPSTLHLWWARRPLAACRAVLFTQLVDDPSGWPERFPTVAEQDAERRRLHRVIEAMVPWEASNDERIIGAARFEIARSVAWGLGEEPPARDDAKAILDYLQTKAPPVYDPFCGGGSIPLEAQRLGLRAYGSDLNPVAVLISKALVEIPPKFAGRPPVNPEARALAANGQVRAWKGAQGLAEDVRYYGRWMREEAEKLIGHLYPKATLPDGSEATVIAWLWARTVRSPDPAAKGAMVPLVSSFMLSTKEGKKAWVEPVIDPAAPDGWRFEVRTGALSKADEERLKKGSMSRAGGTCIVSGALMPLDYIRAFGQKEGLGIRLLAVVAEAKRGRVYLAPSEEQSVPMSMETPDAPEIAIEIAGSTRDFRTKLYGLTQFSDLFTSRQLTALMTLASFIAEARGNAADDSSHAIYDSERHGGSKDESASYADAVATYLGLAVSKLAAAQSTMGVWSPSMDQAVNAFGRQALPMTWDFPESNVFNGMAGDFATTLSGMMKVLDNCLSTVTVSIRNDDAARSVKIDGGIITSDPPYFDNISYAELSDYFYVWQRHALAFIYPSLYRRITTPKDKELIASNMRHEGAGAAEEFFLNGMEGVLRDLDRTSANNVPMALFYAFKQSEVVADGLSSPGWSSFLQAVMNAGWLVDGTWPIRTERATGLKANMNSLASSIVLVCRKRHADASTITRAEFVRALKREMPPAIDVIRKAGVGPVDMQQSVIGPGMGVFSRHSKVLEDDDSAMSVKTALALINRVWEEIENELDAAFDAETQVALAWFATHGFEAKASGELITLANAKNVPSAALFASGVFKDLRGRACLTPRAELPADWSPARDKTLTVWECVQHVARVLAREEGGGEAAAAMVREMGAKSADARALAYRLYEIASNKGWAAEALVYNELAQEWTKLEDRTASAGFERRLEGAAQLELI